MDQSMLHTFWKGNLKNIISISEFFCCTNVSKDLIKLINEIALVCYTCQQFKTTNSFSDCSDLGQEIVLTEKDLIQFEVILCPILWTGICKREKFISTHLATDSVCVFDSATTDNASSVLHVPRMIYKDKSRKK